MLSTTMSKEAYAPVNQDDGGEDILVEAIALTDLSRRPTTTVKEFVEVRSPLTIMGAYELTVELDGCNWVVLVVCICVAGCDF
jgi:hypothetical protein